METPPDALLQESYSNSPDSIVLRSIREITYGSVRILSAFLIFWRLSLTMDMKVAGMVSKVFEHPFDLTKVRLQSQVLDETARFKGPIDCLVQTWKKEGVRGLYRVRFNLLPTTYVVLTCPHPCIGPSRTHCSRECFTISGLWRIPKYHPPRDSPHSGGETPTA
jgi:hypothetical protein